MKKFISSVITILICAVIIYYRKPIATFLYKNFIFKMEITIPEVTTYKKDLNIGYVKETDNFYPKNKEEVLDVLYTVLNSGWTEFSFYCDEEYETCFEDINKIAQDQNILGNINNFVHPYNTYETVSLTINNFNKVTITVKHLYSTSDILAIDKEINKIYNEIINDSMTDYEKIKKIHDYIISNTKYDQAKEKDETNPSQYKYKSNMAYGPAINKLALCGGYTDLMALFLEKIGIPNYRIASENHIWNLVYINNEWKHLDLTWDDPVTSNGSNILTHKFFLINTTTLNNLDKEQHIFDKNIYIEAK